MNGKKVLITGIEGFVGSNFFQFIRESCPKAEIYGLDKNVKEEHDFTAISCDLTNQNQIRSVISEIKPNYIFHLAGIVASDDWSILYEGNVKSTISLLEAVQEIRSLKTRIVVIGSAAEYGLVSPDILPIKEDALPNPINRYGASMCCRTILAMTYKNFGLDIIIGRAFNILGRGLSEHLSVGSFAKQIAAIKKGKKERVITTGRLDSRRDFLDVYDVTKALYLLALYGKSGEIYNICSGRSTCIKDILKFLLDDLKLDVKINIMPSKLKQTDIQDIYGSYQKIKHDSGWQPSISLEEGLKRTLEYYMKIT